MQRRWRRARSDRAATLVEYALLVAVLVIPVVEGLSFLQTGARTKMGHVAENVAQSPTTTIDDGSGSDGSGGGATPTSTTAAPTTTAPTTTIAPTTTTQKPTTTTTTTTTTTAPPKPIPATNDAATATAEKTSKSTWSATAATTVMTKDGKPVVGAKVTLEICTRQGNKSSWDCSSQQVTTDDSGVASWTVDDLTKSDTMMQATVTAVLADRYDITVDDSSSTDTAPFCTNKC